MEAYKNKNDNWQVDIEPQELVIGNSFGSTDLGSHASTMELWCSKGGVPEMIEWDIPSLEETEHIGLVFDGKILIDYDGIFSMPDEAIELLEGLGYNCNYAKDNCCWACYEMEVPKMIDLDGTNVEERFVCVNPDCEEYSGQ